MMTLAVTAERIVVEERYLNEVPAAVLAAPPSWQPPGINGFYFDGPEYRGEPTQVFAYMGIPETRPGETVPGIVLVHGGGGTAFMDWVTLWKSRGYAAIAMDLCGCVPVANAGTQGWMRLSSGAGPAGWDAAFDQRDEPLRDQWPYYAVNTIARAMTLLAAQPQVDAERIGITGISWGGYLTCLAASVDSRFAFAVPVYGCGSLGERSSWMERLQQPEMAKWLGQCDPSQYLAQAAVPVMWVTGTNDFHYPLASVQKCAELVAAPVTLSITPRMVHSHSGAGELPEVILRYADSFLRGEAPLPAISRPQVKSGALQAQVQAELPLTRAELHYTCDSGKWDTREWKELPAQWDETTQTVSAALPDGTVQCFFNLYDERGVPVSSPIVELWRLVVVE